MIDFLIWYLIGCAITFVLFRWVTYIPNEPYTKEEKKDLALIIALSWITLICLGAYVVYQMYKDWKESS